MTRIWIDRLCWLFVAWAIVRMAVVVLPAPITGYANNLDFFRESACVGAWQHYDGQPELSAHFSGPVDRVEYTGRRDPRLCLASTDNIFLWAAAHFEGKHATFPLRVVGLARCIAAALLVVFVVARLEQKRARLVAALGFAFVFGDIAVLTYFNTLYSDVSAILPATALALYASRLMRAEGNVGLVDLTFCGALLFWLGGTKEQSAPLALFFGCVMTLGLLCRNRRGPAAVVAVLALLGPLFLFVANSGPSTTARTMERVNIDDVVLGAVLPSASRPAEALRQVGLPEECQEFIGQDGYNLAIRDGAECPGLLHVSRLRLLPLFMAQPETFLIPFAMGVWSSRPSYLTTLSPYARPNEAGAERIVLTRGSSVSTLLTALPYDAYSSLVNTLIISFFVGVPFWIGSLWAKRAYPFLDVFMFGCTFTTYALLSSLLGDGFVGFARHSVGVLTGSALCASAVIGKLLSTGAWVQRSPRQPE